MKVTVSVSGIPEVQKALNELSAGARGRALSDAALVGAQVVLTESMRLVPVVTGNLKNSLHAGVDPPSDTRAMAFVATGPQAPYGKKIEFGGSQKAPKGFLRPPLVTHREEIKEAMVGALRSTMGLA